MNRYDYYCTSCVNSGKDGEAKDDEVCWSCIAMGGIGNYRERRIMETFPAADVVSRDAFNRELAENDDMRAMLAQIGKKPGDSMADVKRVVLCRDCIHARRYTNKIKCGYWSGQTSSEIVCEDDFCSYGVKREES